MSEATCPVCLGEDETQTCPRCCGNGTISYSEEPDTRGADWRETQEKQARIQRERRA